ASVGGNAAALGQFGVGNAVPATGAFQNANIAALNGFAGTGGLLPAQAYTLGVGSYNPLLVNSMSNTAFGFNPAYSGLNPLAVNTVGPNAFFNALTRTSFNPLISNPMSAAVPGLNGPTSTFNNPLIGNITGNAFPGFNTATPVFNPTISNPVSSSVLGFNPNLNLGLGPFGFGPNAGGAFNLANTGSTFNLNGFNAGAGTSIFGGGLTALNTGFPLIYNPFLFMPFTGAYTAYGPVTYTANGYGLTYGGHMLSPYDVPLSKYLMYAMNGNRYLPATGAIAPDYAAANLYAPIAYATALKNYRRAAAVRRNYYALRPRTATTPTRTTRREDLIPRDKLMDDQGNIHWPASAPATLERAAVDQAVKAAVADAHERGRASVRDIVNARDKLEAYGHPTLAELRSKSPADAEGFRHFLNSLDHVLSRMGEPTAAAAAATHIKPENAPKTAGQVFKDALKEDTSKSGPSNEPLKKDQQPKR
ncbi:MAG: hypothetical protein IRY99_25030, partial [Isosphaeraceae bacterium]|nr:hypothetical protein [Isosphaeraceae bacterium]